MTIYIVIDTEESRYRDIVKGIYEHLFDAKECWKTYCDEAGGDDGTYQIIQETVH